MGLIVQQAITGWTCDEHGDWVAHLACGHRQHVRHRPPFQERPWVVTASGRESWVGRPLECRLCDEEADEAGGAGGESPCLAASVCPECGAVLETGGPAESDGGHRPGCGVLRSAAP
jgi:hypothetical protein